ncbi:MAG TPA: hypothetical protein VME23_15010 [Terracidiphilus sp.]|nr:hypothetical protein [Terracidiphilus sp.]
MNFQEPQKPKLWRHGTMLVVLCLSSALAAQGQPGRSILVITSTNNASSNAALVFKLDPGATPSLSLQQTLPTGGQGGAAGTAGNLQFENNLGAVANYGSNTVSQLERNGNSIAVGRTIGLASECVQPDSLALTQNQLFVVGANCAEVHSWPWGYLDGPVVSLPDSTAKQIAVGQTWAAVTLGSGSLLQLPLTKDGALSGSSTDITLPSDADGAPLGAGFWGDILGFTPAHSVDSFAIVNNSGDVFPIPGPTPPFPSNAPCWVAKGPGSVWYTGNAPGDAVSEFFSDAQGGVFYKSVPLPGSPTDLTVSPDQKWLAVVYTFSGEGYVAVFSIDEFGDLTPVTTSSSIGVPSFHGVAISE